VLTVPRRRGKVKSRRDGRLTGGCPEDGRRPAYTDSKGALANMTRILANEWAPLGVDVIGIAPGDFPTRMIAPRSGRAGAVAADETL
jgi:NAD(P)-dependent dehydrogenase (short-subunit alcohol dehydrogenase family)